MAKQSPAKRAVLAVFRSELKTAKAEYKILDKSLDKVKSGTKESFALCKKLNRLDVRIIWLEETIEEIKHQFDGVK